MALKKSSVFYFIPANQGRGIFSKTFQIKIWQEEWIILHFDEGQSTLSINLVVPE